MLVTGGSTDVTTYFQMRLTAGGDATALTITDFDLSYTRSGNTTAAKADATNLGSANAAHSDNGGYEVDPTDCPGLHRFDWPDAAFAAGVREVILTVKHTSCFTESLRVEIDGEVSVTEWNGVKLATTNPLPNAAPDAAGGLPVSDAGSLDLDTLLGHLDADITSRLAPTVASRTLDVTATGAAGVDWGNVENQGTTVDLSDTAINLCDTTTTNTDMRGTDSAALASVATEARLAELDAANLPADVDTLLTRITATIFSGITSLAEWLGALAGKQASDATAQTEIRATGAGSGTYDATTDSQEALRDQGDAAWVTATAVDLNADQSGVTIGTVNAMAGTITTLDALDTAQDTQHAATQALLPAALVGGRIDATIDGTGMEMGAIDAILTRTMTEAYAADGATMTVAQALYEICQSLTEFAVSGTTITVKKRDGATAAMTFTLDDGTNPTSRTRAT